MRVLPALAPGGPPPKVAEAIAGHRAPAGVALVGHEPDLGELAAWLIGAKAPLPFKKGGICRIDLAGPVAARAGQLVWFATPKMLRALK
jgi:phosphohistidine phosphatase